MALENQPPQPVNYAFDIPDPVAGIKQNLELVMGLANQRRLMQAAQMEAQYKAVQTQELRQKLQSQQIAAQRMSDARQAWEDMPHTAEGIAGWVAAFPEMGAQAKEAHEMLDDKERKAQISQMLPIHAAQLNGNYGLAASRANDLADAQENSQNPQEQQKAPGMRKLSEEFVTDPIQATKDLGAKIAFIQGPKTYLETFGKANTMASEEKTAAATAKKATVDASLEQQVVEGNIQKTGAETREKNVETATKAAQLPTAGPMAQQLLQEKELENRKKLVEEPYRKTQLEQEATRNKAEIKKLELDNMRLPPGIVEGIDKANIAITDSTNLAKKMLDLAGTFRKLSGLTSSGITAKIREGARKFLGNEDAVSFARQRFESIKNVLSLAQLKGVGRMTQQEIIMIQSGFPERTSNPQAMVARYLEIAAKAAMAQARVATMSIQWNSINQSPGVANHSFIMGDYQVRPGDSLVGLTSLAPEKVQGMRDYIHHPKADPAKAAQMRKVFTDMGVTF